MVVDIRANRAAHLRNDAIPSRFGRGSGNIRWLDRLGRDLGIRLDSVRQCITVDGNKFTGRHGPWRDRNLTVPPIWITVL